MRGVDGCPRGEMRKANNTIDKQLGNTFHTLNTLFKLKTYDIFVSQKFTREGKKIVPDYNNNFDKTFHIYTCLPVNPKSYINSHKCRDQLFEYCLNDIFGLFVGEEKRRPYHPLYFLDLEYSDDESAVVLSLNKRKQKKRKKITAL